MPLRFNDLKNGEKYLRVVTSTIAPRMEHSGCENEGKFHNFRVGTFHFYICDGCDKLLGSQEKVVREIRNEITRMEHELNRLFRNSRIE